MCLQISKWGKVCKNCLLFNMYKGLQIRGKLFTFLVMSVSYQVWVCCIFYFFFFSDCGLFNIQSFPEDFNFSVSFMFQ